MRGALVSCSKTRSALLVGSSGRSAVPSCGPQFGSWSLTRFRFCLWAMQCERGCRAAHLLRSAQSPSSPCPPPSLPSMHCTSPLSCSKIPPSLCRRQPGAARLRALAFAKIEAEQMVGARSWLRRQPRLFLQQLVAGMLLLAPFSKPLDRTGILLQGGERGICLQGGVGAAGLGMHSMRAAWHRGLRGGDAEVTPMCSALQADPHPVLVQSVRWVFSAVVARGAAWIPSRDGLGYGEQWFITTITSFSVAALRDAMQRWDPEIGLAVGFDGVGGSLPTSCGSVILHRAASPLHRALWNSQGGLCAQNGIAGALQGVREGGALGWLHGPHWQRWLWEQRATG